MIAFSDLSGLIPLTFPNLRDDYHRQLDFWEDEPPAPYFDWPNVVFPYLRQAVLAEDARALTHLFDVIERLALEGDEDVQDFLAIEIGGFLLAERLVDAVDPFLRPWTRLAISDYQFALRHPRSWSPGGNGDWSEW